MNTSTGFSYRADFSNMKSEVAGNNKIAGAESLGNYLGGGRRTRTSDLWVMSPTSYHCSIPRYIVLKIVFEVSEELFPFDECKVSDFS